MKYNNLLNLKDAMSFLNASKSSMHRWEREGKLHSIRTIGGHRRYEIAELNRFLNISNKNLEESDKKDIIIYTKNSSNINNLTKYSLNHHYKIIDIIKNNNINDDKFYKLCEYIIKTNIKNIIFEKKEDLSQFQYKLLQLFSNNFNINLIELYKNDKK